MPEGDQNDGLQARWEAAVAQNRGLENQLASCLEGGQSLDGIKEELLRQHELSVHLAGTRVRRTPPPGPKGWGGH